MLFAVAELLVCYAGATVGRRTCDGEGAGSTHSRALLRNNLGQVVNTLALVIGTGVKPGM